MILGQLRMGARQAKNAPLSSRLRSRKMISLSIELFVIVTSLLSIFDRCHQAMDEIFLYKPSQSLNAHNIDTIAAAPLTTPQHMLCRVAAVSALYSSHKSVSV